MHKKKKYDITIDLEKRDKDDICSKLEQIIEGIKQGFEMGEGWGMREYYHRKILEMDESKKKE